MEVIRQKAGLFPSAFTDAQGPEGRAGTAILLALHGKQCTLCTCASLMSIRHAWSNAWMQGGESGRAIQLYRHGHAHEWSATWAVPGGLPLPRLLHHCKQLRPATFTGFASTSSNSMTSIYR